MSAGSSSWLSTLWFGLLDFRTMEDSLWFFKPLSSLLCSDSMRKQIQWEKKRMLARKVIYNFHGGQVLARVWLWLIGVSLLPWTTWELKLQVVNPPYLKTLPPTSPSHSVCVWTTFLLTDKVTFLKSW
jgi:hypothetical protein